MLWWCVQVVGWNSCGGVELLVGPHPCWSPFQHQALPRPTAVRWPLPGAGTLCTRAPHLSSPGHTWAKGIAFCFWDKASVSHISPWKYHMIRFWTRFNSAIYIAGCISIVPVLNNTLVFISMSWSVCVSHCWCDFKPFKPNRMILLLTGVSLSNWAWYRSHRVTQLSTETLRRN